MAEIFVQRTLNAPLDRVLSALAGDSSWLEAAGRQASRQGSSFDARLRADLGRVTLGASLRKNVRIRVGPVQPLPDKTMLTMSWEAIGFAGLFPVMDALVELQPMADGRTWILFWGRYDPPLGVVGDLTDRFIANRVTEATIDALITALEESSNEPASNPSLLRGPRQATSDLRGSG